MAIVPSGVWVIDTKHYHGRLSVRPTSGCFGRRVILTVGGRDQTHMISSARRQQAAVEAVVEESAPVRAALCFTGVDLPLLARPFVIDGVIVTWPKALTKSLQAAGPLRGDRRDGLVARMIKAFPRYPA
jgi:hypothetical protein